MVYIAYIALNFSWSRILGIGWPVELDCIYWEAIQLPYEKSLAGDWRDVWSEALKLNQFIVTKVDTVGLSSSAVQDMSHT